MADKIRGVTIEIGGDTSGLTKALRNTNTEINKTQGQLKDVERLLKLDPTNTELLSQKQRLLGQAVSETKDKLTALKDTEKKVQQAMSEGKASQDQYDAIKREIIATEDSLKKLETQAGRSNVAMSKIGETAGKISAGAGKVADATRVMSTAAAGALVAIGGAAYKAVTSADDLNTLANQTGFSTADIQKINYASDVIDVDLETITKSAAKMTKNMVSNSKDTQAAFSAIGVSVRDSNGELRNSNDVFYDCLQGLSQVSNETERDTLAMQIFGKSANELAGIVDDGGASLRSLGDDAENLGIIMDQDTLDSLNAVNDQIDKMKAKASGEIAKSGASALEALMPVFDKVMDKISSLLDWIGSLDSGQVQFLLTVLAIIAGISPVAGLISKISTAVQFMSTKAIPGMINIFGKLTGTVFPAIGGAISKVMAFIAANPVALIVAAIVAMIAAIAIFGDDIKAILGDVDAFLQGVFATDWSQIFGPVLGESLNSFFANLSNLWDGIKSIFNGIIDFIRGVFTGDWERAWDGVKEIFSGVFGVLASIVKAPMNAIIGMVNGVIGGLNTLIHGLNNVHFDIPSWVPFLGGKAFGINISDIGKIPYLANGGILSSGSAVVGEAGPELLTMMGNQARVQPLTSNTTNHNLGGVAINVYGAPGQDVHELASIVMDEMQAAVDRRGSVYR